MGLGSNRLEGSLPGGSQGFTYRNEKVGYLRSEEGAQKAGGRLAGDLPCLAHDRPRSGAAIRRSFGAHDRGDEPARSSLGCVDDAFDLVHQASAFYVREDRKAAAPSSSVAAT